VETIQKVFKDGVFDEDSLNNIVLTDNFSL